MAIAMSGPRARSNPGRLSISGESGPGEGGSASLKTGDSQGRVVVRPTGSISQIPYSCRPGMESINGCASGAGAARISDILNPTGPDRPAAECRQALKTSPSTARLRFASTPWSLAGKAEGFQAAGDARIASLQGQLFASLVDLLGNHEQQDCSHVF